MLVRSRPRSREGIPQLWPKGANWDECHATMRRTGARACVRRTPESHETTHRRSPPAEAGKRESRGQTTGVFRAE